MLPEDCICSANEVPLVMNIKFKCIHCPELGGVNYYKRHSIMGQSLSRNGESVHIILLPFIASLLGCGVHELEVRISSRDSVMVVNSRVTQKGWPGTRGGPAML